jgi:plastocyanin
MKLPMYLPMCAVLLSLGLSQSAWGLPEYVTRVPNGATSSCSTCHTAPPTLNAFGNDFLTPPAGGITLRWTAALAALDSDGDGFTNGTELGDPTGVWNDGDPNPAGPIFNPGSATSHPVVVTAPSITTQPINQVITAGANVSFTVVATGTTPLTYQWQRNSVNVAGATDATLSLNVATIVQAGTYQVVVSNGAGSTTSTGASLTVNPVAPGVVKEVLAEATGFNPKLVNVNVGDVVRWSYSAGAPHTTTSGSACTPDGLWNEALPVGATAEVQFSTAGTFPYFCVPHCAFGMTGAVVVASAPVAPSITTQPAAQIVAAGANASFTVVATGSAPITYQWQRNGANVAGANSATLTLNGATIAQAGTYQVVVSNGAGSATSTGATLTVNPASPGALVEVLVTSGNFTPKVANVNAGDVVRWSNPGPGVEHTTTSGAPCTPDGLWNEALPVGATAEVQFSTAGTFPYFCVPHCAFGMTGAVVVLPPQELPVNFGGNTHASGTNLVTDWSGGKGPFVVQQKPLLEDLTWQNVNVTTGSSATIPMTGSSGFLRIYDSGNQPATPFTVYMSGALERPNPVTTTGTGSGTLILEGNTLTFNITYSGLSGDATAAHIHGQATAATSAGVQINLVPFAAGPLSSHGVFSGSVVLTDAQKAMVLSGQTYANVHTAANPGGEIRGQIAPVLYEAELSSAKERPNPVDGPAHGLAILQLVGNQLTMNVTYEGLSGVVTASHIHGPASSSTAAGVLTNLALFNGGAYGTSGSLSGTLVLTDDELAALVDGLTYLNFHTASHPAGEMRGQILPQVAGIPLTATLSPASESPAITNSSASAAASFSLEGDNLLFSIAYSNLTGAATGVHIHGSATNGQNAGIIIHLEEFSVGPLSTNGTVAGSVVVTAQQKDWLLSGLTYVNFHTPLNKAGEIRGQIAPVLMKASLNGANEFPNPVTTTGTGSGTFTLVRDLLGFNVTYRNLLAEANNAHIHGPASTTQSAGVLVSLVPFNGGDWGTNGPLAGRVTLTTSQLGSIIDGVTYVNVHSAANPGGEIRGQLTR